ncbi:complement factor B-like [Colossoma macropomum]|uniref:complement factor B-like n=1 Tax=Colossoma macropomum TaxID=42526 RepID=UPI001864DDAC|nr:complement factor B-like [Colossoma macropomum]
MGSPRPKGDPSDLKCSDSNLDINGGTFTLSNNSDEGSILKYRCPRGYYPYPVKIRQCSRSKWDPAPTKRQLECKKITCPNPHVLDNGVVEPYKLLYYVNDTTTYRCHSDYTFRGSSTRVCQLNADHCPDPGTPPGASRTGHIFNIDDKVTYRCDNKLKLLGSKVRVCQDGGQWSGQEPECYTNYTYDTPAEVAEAFGSTLKTTLTTHEENGRAGIHNIHFQNSTKLVRKNMKSRNKRKTVTSIDRRFLHL